uniref:Uncharacterized protein n=1 Tax=Avena sativa TaxID=4498 RepID=A0ACD5XRI8_AVESA
MKKQAKAATAPTDLLVCFPARQHLALMPKSMCSPSRATLDRAVAARRRQLQLPPAQRSGPSSSSSSGVGGGTGGRGRGSSPLFRGSSKAKQSVEGDNNEPQSPKVTCAGQIKVVRPRKQRPVAAEKNGRCGGSRWIAVAEEMERLQEQRKKASWLEAFGVPLPFLGGALRSLRHKARCFGTSLRAAVESSTDDDDDVEEGAGGHGRESAAAASVFSKWLMVLEGSQEPQSQDSRVHDEEEGERTGREADDDDFRKPSSVPPANALLLMRCRSAPAKGLATKGAEEPPAGEEKGGAVDGRDDDLVFMRTAPDFLKLSIDIAKETWVVGGMDPLARSRSWKR